MSISDADGEAVNPGCNKASGKEQRIWEVCVNASHDYSQYPVIHDSDVY